MFGASAERRRRRRGALPDKVAGCGLSAATASALDGIHLSTALIDQVNQAFQTYGFLCLKNPGIKRLPALRQMAKAFFALPATEKHAVAYRAPVPRGYIGNAKEVQTPLMQGYPVMQELKERLSHRLCMSL